jgi:hypothetical protein
LSVDKAKSMMKKITTILLLSSLLSCSKDEEPDTLCLKVKVVGYDFCSPATMGAQIIEGPEIGDVFRNQDNVIAVFGFDRNKFPIDTVFYCTVRDKKEQDNLSGVCLAIYPNISFSKVLKIAVSASGNACR